MSAATLKRTSLPLFSCEKIKHNFFGSFHSNICSEMFYKIGLLKNFRKLTRKRLCRSLFLIKLYIIKPENSAQMFFTTNFTKLFSVPFSQNSSGECFSFQFNLLNPQPANDVIYIFRALLFQRFQIFLSHFLFLEEARNQSI